MMPISRPMFEVVAAASAEDRRLISVDSVRALTGIATTVTDAALGLMIDATLSLCAKSCRLATYRNVPPTLALESVRATWLEDSWIWPGAWRPSYPYAFELSRLMLPWRAPMVSIEITEGDVELEEGVDFRLLGSGVVERIGSWWPTSGGLVVDYVAGWVPLAEDPAYQEEGETLPPDLIMLIADQIRMTNDRGSIDLNVRSEDIPNVWSGSYNVPGGDAIDTGGLLLPLFNALAPYRAPPSFS